MDNSNTSIIHVENNNVDINTILEQLQQFRQDNEQLKQENEQFRKDYKRLKQDDEQVRRDNEQVKKENEQLKQDIKYLMQFKQDHEVLQLKVAQLEANTYNNNNNNNNNNMSVYQRPHVQKRQKVSQDEEIMGRDDSDGGLPSHLLELICRLVIRYLGKHLPARYEQLVALCAATGLCNDDDVARLRDSHGCRQELLTINDKFHDDSEFTHASYNMAGTQIVCTTSKNVSIWDAKTGYLVRCLEEDERLYNNDVSFNPRGDLIVIAYGDGTARVKSVRTGKCVRVLEGHTDEVYTASYSHDGERIVTASHDGTVRVWNARTGECVRVLRRNDGTKFRSALYSPNDSMIVTVQFDVKDGEWISTACIWDAATVYECRRVLKGHTAFVSSPSFSPDGSLVATASDDMTARIWRVETGKCIHILEGHEGCLASAMFSPDGAHIVTASCDWTIRIWDVADGRQLFLYDMSEDGCVHCMPFACYDPKGTRILACLGDDRLRILSAPVFRFK